MSTTEIDSKKLRAEEEKFLNVEANIEARLTIENWFVERIRNVAS